MLWVKAAHIVSVIAWMAALLYLPRLMVYHASATNGSELAETLKVMERRLLRFIATPALLASWLFGLWLVWLTGAWSEGWFLAKLALVLALTAYHGAAARWVRTFAVDRNRQDARFYRIANEVPTLLLIAIVVLAVVRPF
ncbi:MAG TPA: protoporphyrinogen oxidase HemJ [Afifellaceae bacterium]|nr:protoporphyrinogen oxidase HemJ [Afifellaceae bacterium]